MHNSAKYDIIYIVFLCKVGAMVKLLRLKISKLYDVFDYDVKFNPDVTFIYGKNGCGKTTILNITEIIITGCLFELFNYEFESINLEYCIDGENNKEVISIDMIENGTGLLVVYKKQQYELHDFNFVENDDKNPDQVIFTYEKVDFLKLKRFYFSRFQFLYEIEKTFNYVYLPLNRSSHNKYYSYRKPPYGIPSSYTLEKHIIGQNMKEVERLISSNYTRINTKIRKYDNEFKNQILQILLDVANNPKYHSPAMDFFLDTFEGLKKDYSKVLKQLGLYSEDKANSFEEFVDKFKDDHLDENQSEESLKYRYCEILRIKDIVEIAKKNEEKINNEIKPINMFIDVVNTFIKNDNECKTMKIDAEGRIYIESNYSRNRIDVDEFSSGEKQIVTFFANLIFGVPQNQSGIFIVDEPEISLHLAWQHKFVTQALKINKNLQLIFATHAPEIIGSRRDKMFELKKKYNNKEDV